MADIPFEVTSDLRWDNPPDFTWETGREIVGQSRWSTYFKRVIRSVSEPAIYFEITWAEGSTEQQDCDPDVQVTQVYPHQVIITKYKPCPVKEAA